jgi:cell division protein FtsL
MGKFKMNCGYCGRKCSLEKDFCIPQDSVYICKSCYDWQNKVSNLEAKLAESEVIIKGGKEEIKDLHRKINEIVERDMNCIQQLKQQITEKDKQINTYAKEIAHLDKKIASIEQEKLLNSYGMDKNADIAENYKQKLDKQWLQIQADANHIEYLEKENKRLSKNLKLSRKQKSKLQEA